MDMMDMKNHGMDMPPEEEVGFHGMAVVGEKSVYLYHLPMFMKPHNFQAILEASFVQGANSVQELYVKDRRSNPKSKLYTLAPLEDFQLTTLFTPTPPARSSFKAKVFRGHFERKGKVAVSGLTNFDVKVKRVLFLNELGTMTKPAKLTYRLFGRPDELFLLHVVAAPPDFDQIISVKIDGHQFTEQELSSGVEVVFTDRANTATARLKEKEKSRAQGHVTGAHQFLNLNVEGLIEFYLEEGELAK